MKKFVTTAIDYVNSLPHIGTAYEKIGADSLVRFWRQQGNEVYFQMGNDEHSANVQKSAAAKNLPPKVYCDEMRPRFEAIWQRLGISYNQFLQTSNPRHAKAAQDVFDKIFATGDITPCDYEGWYCESCEAYFTEKDLVDQLCPNHKTKPRWLKEKNFFFKLSKYAPALLTHIDKNPSFILPAKRRNEIVNFIKQGLEDVSISRSTLTWGIPLPAEKRHVMWVWFEALIGYLTLIGFADDPKQFAQYWPVDLHVVGKDIMRFHCTLWPAMLMSAGIPLPRMVFGHGFVTLTGEKMSKSLGNVVTPLDILEAYPEFGADALRYYLLRSSSFGDDGDFTWDGFITRYNADLANGIGNLAARSVGMVSRYQGGIVKPLDSKDMVALALIRAGEQVYQEIADLMDAEKSGDIQTHFVLEKIWAYIKRIDQYIDASAPWTLAKEGKQAVLSQFLSTVVECVKQVAILTMPFIPLAAAKIWRGFGFDVLLKAEAVRFETLGQVPFLKTDHKIVTNKLIIFPRIEVQEKDAKNQAEVKKSAITASASSTPPSAPAGGAQKSGPTMEGLVDIADFQRLDLRVARILKAEKVEKADKLLRLELDLGGETRQIIAGIAAHYAPEDLVGKSIVVVVNLKPAKIRGIESHGMLLAAKQPDGTLALITPEKEIASNSKVG